MNKTNKSVRKKINTDKHDAALVLRRFRVIFNAVRTHFRLVEKEVGLGGAQVWALSIIAAQPGIGTGGVAEAMDIHQTTASNLVKVLLKKKLIKTTKSESDGRAVCLELLPAGSAVLANMRGPFEGVLPVALRSLKNGTLKRLHDDLGELIEVLNADEDAHAIPLANL